jgi:hypothetical protein
MAENMQFETRKVMRVAVPITSATSFPLLRKEGVGNNVCLYAYNLATCSVYGLFRGCGFNTAATAQWFNIGTTATIAASSVTAIASYSVSALQLPINYITFEYAAGATGGVSALTLQLSIW